MGGRGSKSGINNHSKISGLDVSKDGETTRYYFFEEKRQRFYQRGIDGMPEPAPLNMSGKEFKERVEKNGAKTKVITASEYKREQEKYNKERENRPDYELGVGLSDNREYRKRARTNRIINRTMKKK